MVHLPINLFTRHRLDLRLVKRREDSNSPIIPNLSTVLRTRSGNKISRFFRHVFEHKKIKKLIGTNLALMIFTANLIDTSTDKSFNNEEINLREVPLILTTEKTVQYPLKEIKISQGYKFYHPGIDFDGITGDEVYPIMNGRVREINYSKLAYGNAVLIDHEGNFSSLYAHLSQIDVKPGQELSKSDTIGNVGSTGFASGDHLHLEIHKNGKPIDPSTVLP